MKVTKEHKEKMRVKILSAAGRVFRKLGYGGVGIDGLAKEAGVTSGAFYGHFTSKEEAFQETVTKGLSDLTDAIGAFKAEHGDQWVIAFLDYYLGKTHRCNLAESCVVPGLSAEVMRSPDFIREAYTSGMKEFVVSFVKEQKNTQSEDVWVLMSLLAGSVILSRAVKDEKLADKISNCSKKWAQKIVSNK